MVVEAQVAGKCQRGRGGTVNKIQTVGDHVDEGRGGAAPPAEVAVVDVFVFIYFLFFLHMFFFMIYLLF